MNLGPIAEVAIGIIFVWIVLSLTTIQIQEWISTRLDKRARDMEDAIHEMLANPNLKAQFYDHPVIRSLTAKKRKEPSRIPVWFYRYPILRGFTKEKRKLPSYIPSQQFSLALFDIAITAGTESSLIQQGILKVRDDLQRQAKVPVDQAVIVELNLLSDLARSAAATEAGTAFTKNTLALLKTRAEDFALKYPDLGPLISAALEEAENRKADIDELLKHKEIPKASDAFNRLERGVAALSVISPEFNQTLNALLLNIEEYLSGGETKLAKARKSVEKWFDDSMDRASGVFKRYSQTMALAIGFLIALLLNVDSINLTLYLWREPAVREALAQNAANFEIPQQEFESDPIQALQDFTDQFTGLSLPVGWVINDSTSAAISDINCKLFPGEQQAFGIPVIGTNKCVAPPQSNNQNNILLKLIGIFITALAARQGAPFWFDILKRVVNLRGTGANPVEKEGK
jgi:hypothetical protein